MDTWIVTGGAGFIGSNFVRLVLETTAVHVVVIDKLTYAGSLESLPPVEETPRLAFVQADIVDRVAVAGAIEKHRPSAIINFAAESHVDRSIDGPAAFIDTNIRGAFELLDAARHYVSGLGRDDRARFRFLQVSTDEVFGTLGKSALFTERTAYAPNSPYSASKASADHLARAYHVTYGLPVVITNTCNNYGPYQFPEKLIPLMILNAVEGRALPIYGDGKHVRDWIYVRDHCEGILAVLERGRVGEAYNIGAQAERQNLEVVDRICDILERERPAASNPALVAKGIADYKDLKTFVTDRHGHDRRYAIDATKIRNELGWEPRHDFDEGMAETVQWYLDNFDWCEAVQVSSSYHRQRLGLGKSGATS
ncbi:MAG: dTDP-glucose 4,6-dehydratase [Acidobacteriota bacterium]|nr:dTDP-glucose 4,6-dehydratase [Acidobacteriota bacterium]